MYQTRSMICFFLVLLSKDILSCEFGWHHGGRSCYHFSRITTDFLSASSFCRAYGGYVVEIDDLSEYNTLKRMTRHRKFYEYWIGLVDYFGEGVWLKAKSLTQQRFTRWGNREPNNMGSAEHCALSLGNTHLWNDTKCHYIAKFICEKRGS